MRLTAFTDFGLRVLMRLAGEPSRPVTTEEIAMEFRISRHHLTKVTRTLAGAGLIESRRGAGGGLRLGRPANAITVGEAVRLLEARQALVECFREDGGQCVLTPRCRLKHRLHAAEAAFLATLDAATLADCAYPPAGEPIG